MIEHARLIDVRRGDELFGTMAVERPPLPAGDGPLPRHLADEALILARHLDRHADRLHIAVTGRYAFPVRQVADARRRRRIADIAGGADGTDRGERLRSV